MNIELEKQKQQFENLSNKTQCIIDARIVDSKTESIYNSIKEEWLSLKNAFDNWQDVSFTNVDIYTVPEYYYRKFSDDCKLKMHCIKSICNEQLSIINAKLNDEKLKIEYDKIEKSKQPLLSTSDWLAIITILTTILIAIFTKI